MCLLGIFCICFYIQVVYLKLLFLGPLTCKFASMALFPLKCIVIFSGYMVILISCDIMRRPTTWCLYALFLCIYCPYDAASNIIRSFLNGKYGNQSTCGISCWSPAKNAISDLSSRVVVHPH